MSSANQRPEKLVPRRGKNIFLSDGKIGVTKKLPNLRNLRQNKKNILLHYLDCFHTLLGKFTKQFEQFFHVISIRKSESQEHYQSWAFGLGLAKFSLDSLFLISITWKNCSHSFHNFPAKWKTTK